MQANSGETRITAVLGPTNTGKTHLAVERMLGHSSGMIGCPLRLLAREIYDRIKLARGSGAVALITGEEKIVPAAPRYFVCTVESMPLDRQVEFLAIDEVQLAADPKRGHVFTDRLLHARGLYETMFLGAATMAPLIRRLVPEAEFVSRPRFSILSYAGERKINRLKPRSVLVAFSAADVYAMAEAVRRAHGGAAVVMGALSPRTRNAQVELFQSGEVDYLVATDAIGMGLNMHVDHVAFAEIRKFDGREARNLTAAEIGQIAGRAGRHMRDGTFGTTADVGPLAPDIVNAVEDHSYAPLRRLYWRNARLDLSSVKALLRGLEAAPPRPELIRPRDAEDLLSLRALTANPDIAALAQGHDAVALLWEVCRIPDFRKTMTDAHVGLLSQIYRHLAGPTGVLPRDWVHGLVEPLDHVDGDIDTLAARIAHVRTWNYVAHRPDWVADARALQERARAIEDRLSDALHERLTHRFVDRRAAALARGLKERANLVAAIKPDGAVVVEGHAVGHLDGLVFRPDDAQAWRHDRVLRAAIRRALTARLERRVAEIARAPDDAFTLNDDNTLGWAGATLARLAAGTDLLDPAVDIVASPEMVDSAGRERLRRRLETWLRGHLRARLDVLYRALDAPLRGPARGLVYQLVEGLGSLPCAKVRGQIAALDADDRKRLARLGVRLGRESVFMPAMLKPPMVALRARLWSLFSGMNCAPPSPGRVSVPVDAGVPGEFHDAIGYARRGALAIRVDILERLGATLRRRARAGPFAADGALMTLAGARAEDFASVLRAMGYDPVEVASDAEADPAALYAARPRRQRNGRNGRKPHGRRPDAASPFAELANIKLGSP
jgi:ATP-dependent RNA helicase SUPV3L1/SUV3